MSKFDRKQQLATRKAKRPSRFVYNVLMYGLVKPFIVPKFNAHYHYNIDIKKIDHPCILVSNHTSRCDWMYLVRAFKGIRMNFVAGYNEFYRSHLHFIFDITHIIPKRNFTSDVHTIKEMSTILKGGGVVCLFPEGKSSISGTNQPVMIGTGKLVKHFKVPVYYTRISGGYMSNTQWNIKDRPGRVDVLVDRLFTEEESANLSVEEIEDRMNEALYNDDFEWNKTARIKYKGNENVGVKLDEHLYLCPKCGKEFVMHGEKNMLRCTACGNGMTIDEYYDLTPLDNTCVIPKTLRVWFDLQRRAVYREVQNPDFKLTDKVALGTLPRDHYIKNYKSSEITGEGVLTLDRNELTFEGTRDGKPFSFRNSILNVPSLPLVTDSSYFGTYIDGEYLEFHPERKSTTKWLLAVEECHRAAGGKWVNNLPRQQWIYDEDKPTDKDNYYL